LPPEAALEADHLAHDDLVGTASVHGLWRWDVGRVEASVWRGEGRSRLTT
jgi:hypothetical protein